MWSARRRKLRTRRGLYLIFWMFRFPLYFIDTLISLHRNTSSSSFHLHHVHPFTPNCKKLALIYTLPSSSGSVCEDPLEYGGDVIAVAIDCWTLSLPGVADNCSSIGGWDVPPFKCCCCTSTTWIGIEGACITPEFDPRFPCALSIKSIDVVVVGVVAIVGAPDENLMLYGWRFVSFYVHVPQSNEDGLLKRLGGCGWWWLWWRWRWQDAVKQEHVHIHRCNDMVRMLWVIILMLMVRICN